MAEKNTNIRLLKADEIECRIGTISEKGLSLLLYKDARVDMKILDEVYGTNNWQRHHEVIGGNLYCTVEIWDDEKRQWIEKQDVGTESMTEKEKGAASDAFKRACVSLGIGRELYTAPFIWIPSSKADIQTRNGKFICNDKFSVSSITYSKEREITALTIVNGKGNVVYSMAGRTEKVEKEVKTDRTSSTDTAPQADGTAPRIDYVSDINKELERTGVAVDAVLRRFGISSLEDVDENIYKKAMNSLRRTRSKAA